MPKARRYGIGLDTDDAHAEIIAALIGQVRRYDLGCRPHGVAPRLIWSATRQLRQARDRNKTWQANTVALAGIDTTGPTADASDDGVDMQAETTMAMAVHDGAVTATDAALITATHLAGLPLRDTATLVGLRFTFQLRSRPQAAPTRPSRAALLGCR